jgi:ribosomal protein S18 acetylase RimI-like enzyme
VAILVKTDSLQIRRLVATDAAAYRGIRLDGLRRSPEAFGSTFEAESVQPVTFFSDRLVHSETFGAFQGFELVGVAGLLVAKGTKEAHKGLLVGMYVRPDSRRAGVGRRLVEAIIEVARARVEIIQLAVVSDNHQARNLYASLGFVEYGLEKKSLKQDGRYYDEVLMAKELQPD